MNNNQTVCQKLLSDLCLLSPRHSSAGILRGMCLPTGECPEVEGRRRGGGDALITKQSGILMLERNPRLKGGIWKSVRLTAKTAEEAQLQRKCVKCAELVLWTRMSWDRRELFGFCARHFITKTTEKTDGYRQKTAKVSLQFVPVSVHVEQASKEKVLKCGEAFFPKKHPLLY